MSPFNNKNRIDRAVSADDLAPNLQLLAESLVNSVNKKLHSFY